MTLPLVENPVERGGKAAEDAPIGRARGRKRPASTASDAELAVMQLESQIASCKHEIASIESDIERVNHHSETYRDFVLSRSKFNLFEERCKAHCMHFTKEKSLQYEEVEEAEQAIFLTRARFLKELLERCEKYRTQLFHLLERPENTKFQARRRTLSENGKQILLRWFNSHFDDPFPSAEEKEALAEQAGASVEQISTWFINARARRWVRRGNSAVDTEKRKRSKSEIMV